MKRTDFETLTIVMKGAVTDALTRADEQEIDRDLYMATVYEFLVMYRERMGAEFSNFNGLQFLYEMNGHINKYAIATEVIR